MKEKYFQFYSIHYLQHSVYIFPIVIRLIGMEIVYLLAVDAFICSIQTRGVMQDDLSYQTDLRSNRKHGDQTITLERVCCKWLDI